MRGTCVLTILMSYTLFSCPAISAASVF